jgi:hypothetical protein
MAEIVRERGEHRCDHLVQVYREPVELAESVATFFAAGFDDGEPAVAVVCAAHWPEICRRLERHGHDAATLEAAGMLIVRDAHETLEAISEGSAPAWRPFKEIGNDLLDLAAAAVADRRPRVFGEMVDILVRRDDRRSADVLEGFWNDLAAKRSFTLLCGYRVDLFDVEAHISLLPQVYRSHTHVLPALDADRIELAVGRALTEVLGEADSQKVYAQVARQEQAKSAPASHLALMWVSAHMPRTAAQVLAAARTHYSAAAAA